MRRVLCALLLATPLAGAAPPSGDRVEPVVPRSIRLVTGPGLSGFGTVGLQLSGQLDYWTTPFLGLGGDAGMLVADAGREASNGLHAGPSLTLRSSPGPSHWLLGATVGGAYAEAYDTWCTEEITWNEGSCETSEWIGWGAHLGAQAGRMGGSEGNQMGLLVRADFVTPHFGMATLNLAFGWY